MKTLLTVALCCFCSLLARAQSQLYFISGAQSLVGLNGQTFDLKSSDGFLFTNVDNPHTIGDLHVVVQDPSSLTAFWSIQFQTVGGVEFAPGLYLNAEQVPFQGAGHPGLDLFYENTLGGSRSYSAINGEFRVLDFTRAGDGSVATATIGFYQQNATGPNNADAWEFGYLKYVSPSAVPEPSTVALLMCGAAVLFLIRRKGPAPQ